MKKFIIGLIILILLLIGSIYGVLFTKTGNNFVASYIENKVNDEQNDVKLKVNDFTLTFKTLNFNATIDDNSNINISGDLKLFEKIVDLKYDIKVKELRHFEKLIKQKLNGPFFTSGIFKGNEKSALIEGISDVAQSETKYKINLINFEPVNIDFLIDNAKIDKLLTLLNQPIYATGNLDIKGDIKNAKIGQLDGVINANISKGKLVNKVVNKEFKQNIASRIGFTSTVKAKLIGNNIQAKSDLITSIADIFAPNTMINLKTKKIVSDYKINMKNLSKLQGVIGKKLNGEFIANGNIVIENDDIKIDGKSDILSSNTTYNIQIEDSQTKDISFEIKDAKIDKLLHMFNEPVYAIGNLNINGKIDNSSMEKLDGSINTTISKGQLVNEVINTVFKQNLKEKVSFKGNINTKLIPNNAHSTINLDSSLASINMKKTEFSFKNSGINSDYTINIPSLDKLKGFTGKKLRGSLKTIGNFSSKSGALVIDGNSDLLGGKLNFNLKNNDLVANLKDAQIKKLTYMLDYPEIFDSKADFNLDYNLLLKKGKIKGNLVKGHFLPNDFSTLINQFSKFDLTREIYNSVDINSTIENMVLNSVVNMKSKNTTIDVTDSILNLNNNTTNTKIQAKIKKTKFGVIVKGNTSNPKIRLDAKDLIKGEVNKQLEKHEDKIKEKLNKVLDGKLGDDGAKEIIKNFKSLF